MDSLARLLFATGTCVFDAMSPTGLAKIKLLSKTHHQLELQYESMVFSLHRLYGFFFNDSVTIESFRELQLTTEAIASGSAVVRFLSRSSFIPSDLDIFAKLQHVVCLGRFLTKCGYKYVPLVTVVVAGVKISEHQHSDFETAVRVESLKSSPNTGTLADRYEFTTVAGVFNFVKGSVKVQLVAARTEPVEVVLGFYSTLVMNIVTATEVMSLYPRNSFVFGRALYLKQGTRTVDAARQKYETRGWQSYDVIAAEEFLRPQSEISAVIRWVGDPYCWIVPLAPLRCGDAVGSNRALKVASWQLTCGYDSTWVLQNKMENRVLDRTYPITWNAQMSVWHHPCFSSMEERSVVTKRGLPLGTTGLATISAAKLAAAVEEVNSHVVPEGSSGKFRQSTLDSSYLVLGFVASQSRCSHRMVLPSSTLDSVLVDFLNDLYPLLAEEHRSSWPLQQLRSGFSSLKSIYDGRIPPLRYPTGHVVTMILQCLEDIDVSGLCDNVQIRVSFAVDTERQMVTTLCDVEVTPERLALIEKEIPAWSCSDDFMEVAGLTVRVRSV